MPKRLLFVTWGHSLEEIENHCVRDPQSLALINPTSFRSGGRGENPPTLPIDH